MRYRHPCVVRRRAQTVRPALVLRDWGAESLGTRLRQDAGRAGLDATVPLREGPGHHVTRSGGATMRKYGMVVGAAVTVAGALGAWLLVGSQYVSGGKSGREPRALVLFGPIPCQPAPPDIVPLTPLERLGKDILYDCFLSDP